MEPSFYNTHKILNLDQSFGVYTKPHILTNETGLDQSMQKLMESSCHKNSFHVGFSNWFNFDVIVARRTLGAIIGDISDLVFNFFSIVQHCILSSPTRNDFIREMSGIVKQEQFCRLSAAEELCEDFKKECMRGGSWISSDASFAYIKGLYEQNKIFFLRIDITDNAAFKMIKDFLDVNHFYLDTLYVSNIGDWLRNQPENQLKLSQMKASIEHISENKTFIIDASYYFVDEPSVKNPIQKIFFKENYHPSQIRLPIHQP
jgi:hypothetical protein